MEIQKFYCQISIWPEINARRATRNGFRIHEKKKRRPWNKFIASNANKTIIKILRDNKKIAPNFQGQARGVCKVRTVKFKFDVLHFLANVKEYAQR